MSITIIGGKLKGRKIKIQIQSAKFETKLRPILARVRKSLFDIVRYKLEDANFLDLYAGSGTVGIEAISRGAKFVVFVDSDMASVRSIEETLNKLGVADLGKIYRADILDGLKFLEHTVDSFDIIFLGPPYREFLVNRTIEIIQEANMLSPSGWIIAQHHKKESINPDQRLELFRQKKYGDTVLSFLKYRK